MEVVVKIFGTTPPCQKCKLAEKIVDRMAKKFKSIKVERFDALSEEGDKYGVMVTPTIVVNDKIIATGKVPSEEKMEEIIKKELEE
ncbi:MAG: thioredoxin family protein [Methanobacteriales archaeon]|nr:thioredoxin family protein [Methanobacteriales archaeon]HOQ19635.1 thioredoxin family protein [Methanothermobacter sp.]